MRRLHFHMDKFLRIMQVGLPAGMQSVIFNISNVLIQSSVNSFGSVVIAGNAAAANVGNFVYQAMNTFLCRRSPASPGRISVRVSPAVC